LKPERWGSPLVQEKYREEKACDRHPYRIITMIIIIIIIIIIPLARNAVSRQGFRCIELVQDGLQWRTMLSVV